MTRGKSLGPVETGRSEPIGGATGYFPVSFESELVFPQARHSLRLQKRPAYTHGDSRSASSTQH